MQLLFHQRLFFPPYSRCLGVKESCCPIVHQFACKLCHSVLARFQISVKCVGALHGQTILWTSKLTIRAIWWGCALLGLIHISLGC